MRQLSRLVMPRRAILAGAFAAMLGGCASVRSPGRSSAEKVGRTAAAEWASRPAVTPYVIPDVTAPHYAEAGAALGVARLADNLADADLRALVRDRWAQAKSMVNSANHVDANVIGVWAMQAGSEDDLRYGVGLADAQWNEIGDDGLTTQARYWIDDIWMIGALQTQAWRATGEARFLDRAALMAVRYLERLQQPNGLFHHGLDSPFFWGRGNGWVAAGLAEILSVLPAGHPHHPAIARGFGRMAEALLRTQRSDGLWGQLIDHPEAWSESSGSAMFAYALLRGANGRLLPDSPYRATALRAWEGLQARVESDGRLRDVCVGTGKSDNTAFYLARPTVTGDLHGQAPLLWLAAELLSRPG